jgi:hypothetical protein
VAAVATPERLTIDMTAAWDILRPQRPHHAQGLQLLAMAERGEVVLAVAPQGHRLDVVERDLVERLRAVLPGVTEAPQAARVSAATVPGAGLRPGQVVKGLEEAWSHIGETWGPNDPKKGPPGLADRYHVESHLIAQGDVFITNDGSLLAMCRRLRAEYGMPIDAMRIEEYVSWRQPDG